MSNQDRLEQILRCRHVCVSIVTVEEGYALALVRNASLVLHRPLMLWSISGGVQDALLSNSPTIPDTSDAAKGLMHLAGLRDRPLCVTLDLAAHLRHERTLRVLRNLLNHFRQMGSQLIMIDHQAQLPDVVRAYATPFVLELPEPEEIEQIVRETLRKAHRRGAIEIDITRHGWHTVLRNLRGLSRRQIEQIVFDCVTDDRRFDEDDINHILAGKRRALGGVGLLEYVETPVSLEEIGGLRRLKEWLAQRETALTGKAKAFGLSAPRGVLMLGVQGAGKSLCAKAIATAWDRPLLRMDVGALYDRYVGESERRLRDALHQAESMSPIVLWIDEIEKAFASAAAQSTDGGLSKRMFGTLLTWMQENDSGVFLVATANDIEALPPELLRKGRFDEIFFVDLPSAEARARIFAIHLKKRGRDPRKFDLDQLAETATGYSGAEIEQGIIAALHDAFAKGVELDTACVVKAIQGSPPLSVTRAEQVTALRQWAASRCAPAN